MCMCVKAWLVCAWDGGGWRANFCLGGQKIGGDVRSEVRSGGITTEGNIRSTRSLLVNCAFVLVPPSEPSRRLPYIANTSTRPPTHRMFKPTPALQGTLRRLPLSTKQAGREYYKGNRVGSMGTINRYGNFTPDWNKIRTYVFPVQGVKNAEVGDRREPRERSDPQQCSEACAASLALRDSL